MKAEAAVDPTWRKAKEILRELEVAQVYVDTEYCSGRCCTNRASTSKRLVTWG
jgi:hypothetical protein